MIPHSFFPTFRHLRSSRKFIIYSALYGLTTLIVPLAVQFLVNNLALSGLWLNIAAFIFIIAFGLLVSFTLNYCQVILNEFIQRELFFYEVRRWKMDIAEKKRIYFVEVFFLLKSYSKAFSTMVEIGLTTIFGLLMIMTFHPMFLIFPMVMGAVLYQIWESTKPAIEASIRESDEKYNLYEAALSNEPISLNQINTYLTTRDERFGWIKKNTIKIAALFTFCQLTLLGGGTWLVQADQLSVGQLVSAEIIFSGIMISFSKLASALEGIYEYETSIYKLKKAKGELHD
jgi:ABC-type bacteriocin/lantibiotic exporter with double-glycine peptidase domain